MRNRVAIGVQVNKRIEHMEHVDHSHVMWWASHAEGCKENNSCSTNGLCNDYANCINSHPDNDVSCCNDQKNQIQALYGVSAKDLNLAQEPHRRMASKLIWQHYRQALDKEFLVWITNYYLRNNNRILVHQRRLLRQLGHSYHLL